MTKKKKRIEQPLQVGFSRIEITPAGSLDMGGYIARQEPACGAHDPLFVKAISFGDGKQSVLLLSVDLLHLSDEWCKTARERISKRLGIPAAHILLAATHTHSGPAVFFPVAARSEAIAEYEEGLLELCCNAAEQAVAGAEPSVLKETSARTAGIVLNRRDLFEETEDLLSVVRIEDMAGKVRGHLVSFSCHLTVMSPANLEYSADLFGAAAEKVEKKYNNSFCVMFNGAAGDLSTRFLRRGQSWEELDRFARKLARQIISASAACSPVKTSPIFARVATMTLPFRAVLPVEKAQKEFDEAARAYSNFTDLRGDWEKKRQLLRARAEGASAQLLISRLGGWRPLFGDNKANIELQVVRIGDLIFCAIPGELFSSRGIDIFSAARPKRGIIIGYANGYWGYLTPPKELQKGGYEAMMAPLLARDEPKIIKQMKALIGEIKSARAKSHA